jgi:hypothetical protein
MQSIGCNLTSLDVDNRVPQEGSGALRRGKRIARELHDGSEKDRDPGVYWAVGVGDTGFETASGTY